MAVLSSCGAPLRDAVTPEDLQARRYAFRQQDREEYRQDLETIFRRMELIALRKTGSGGPTFDILMIHGGGVAGGFAAGVLAGWGRVTDPDFARPEFDMVTGSSSGSLVAPFAFIGSRRAYARALNRANNPPTDWGSLGLGSLWPTRAALLDNRAVARFIEEELDAGTVAQIKRAAEQHKVLLVATTNLDLGLARIWDLADEARRAVASGDRRRIHQILLASTALPILFPPVEIDGTLYTDGGVAATLFLGLDFEGFRWLAERWRRKHPGTPMPRIRIWGIINAQGVLQGKTIQPRYFEVGARSLEIMMEYDRLKAVLYYVHMIGRVNQLPGMRAELRYLAIPQSAYVPKDLKEFKNRSHFRSLVQAGRRLGADPSSWSSETPDLNALPGARVPRGP